MIYRFADCVLDIRRLSLMKGGEVVHVEPQVFDLLVLLARRAGETVTKDELIDSIWHGLNVSDATISARISVARSAVGDDGKTQAIIRTVARRGICMVATVEHDQPTVAGSLPDRLSGRTSATPDHRTARRSRGPRRGRDHRWSGSATGSHILTSTATAASGDR